MMSDAVEWTTITSNVMQIIANAGWVVVSLGVAVSVVRRIGAFIGAVITLAKLSEQLPAVVQGYATLKTDMDELKVGQETIVANQNRQQVELNQLKADVGDLRQKQLGHGKTHVNLSPPRLPPSGLDYADEDETE